ncbi:MAG: glycosyltransferase family 4 protein [Patescibacteria group bacterium]
MKNNEIRLLLVLPFFYPHRGGSQKYAEEIYATMIKNHPNLKVDVLCYNSDRTVGYEEYRGFRIYRVPCITFIPARFLLPNPLYLIPALVKLSRNHYHFVNTHIRFFDPTWWLWIYAKIIGAKSIFTGHVATHPVYQNKIVENISKFVDLTIASFSLSFYDYITFTNKAVQKFFREKLRLRKESYIVYGGVDTNYFTPSNKTNRVLSKLNIPIADDVVLVTYVGRLIWTKGITYLYDAIKEVLKVQEAKNTLFVLGGPGELETEMKNLIQQDGLENKVLLTGDLKYDQVKELLGISDIFINPSHHNEGFPNTVLEAGSAGCYVIATDNAGTREVLRNGETGTLVPQKNSKAFEEAITWALTHKEERQKIADNFRQELIIGFDWKVISEQLYTLLKQGLIIKE